MGDKLIKEIKEKFEISEINLGWNHPPEDIFDNAIKEVTRKKRDRRRRGFIWIFSLTGIFIVGVIGLYISSPSAGQGIHKAAAIQEVIVDNLDSPLDFEKDHHSHSATVRDIKSRSDVQFASGTVDSNRTSDNEQKAATSDNGKGYHLDNSAVLDKGSQDKTVFVNRGSLNRSGESDLVAPLNIYNPVLLVMALPSQTVFLKEGKEDMLMIDKTVEFLEESDLPAQKEWYIGYGRNYSSIHMESNVPSEYSLIGYDQRYEGFEISSGISIPIANRLRINNFISFQKRNNQSVFEQVETRSSKNFSSGTNGMMVYEMNQQMTPFGMVHSNIKMEMDQKDMTDVMLNKTSINQDLYFASFGTELEYSLANSRIWGFSVSTGLSFNHLLSVNTDTHFFMYDEKHEEMGDIQYAENTLSQPANDFLGFSVGAKLERRFSNNKSLFVRLSHHSSLTNLLEHQNIHTRLLTTNLRLGMSSSF